MAERIKVVCLECGKRWSVSPKSDPQCPKCNGVDYEVVDEPILAFLRAVGTKQANRQAR
jgi:Zn finger protein HypA/HybF involved in hydrogenase expression